MKIKRIKKHIQERAILEADMIIERKLTVREVAKELYVSKNVVFLDVTERLNIIDPDRAKQVRLILDYHKFIRHIKGGLATKSKYKKVA